MIDKENGLYLVKSGNKYGVLNDKGNTIIHLEYDQIGIDSSKFPSNNIKNKYLLFDELIPVYQNNKWGIFNKNGEPVVPVEFDVIGCIANSKTNPNWNNVLIIPSYKSVVLGKTKDKNVKYGIYDNTGKEFVPCRLTSVYSKTSAGVDTYNMEFEGQTIDVEEYIHRVYEREPYTINN